MKKTFFIIPGFRQKSSNHEFSWLIKFLKQRGYNVIGAPIDWKGKTNTECAEDFKNFYNKHKSNENCVLGFSYGAVITLISANVLKFNKIYLCSLSPDFSEDLSAMKPWIKKYLGKKRIMDSQKRSGRKLAKGLKAPSIIFYGGKEAKQYPQLKIRCEETAQLAKRSRVVIAENAPHNLSYPSYQAAIKTELSAR